VLLPLAQQHTTPTTPSFHHSPTNLTTASRQKNKINKHLRFAITIVLLHRVSQSISYSSAALKHLYRLTCSFARSALREGTRSRTSSPNTSRLGDSLSPSLYEGKLLQTLLALDPNSLYSPHLTQLPVATAKRLFLHYAGRALYQKASFFKLIWLLTFSSPSFASTPLCVGLLLRFRLRFSTSLLPSAFALASSSTD